MGTRTRVVAMLVTLLALTTVSTSCRSAKVGQRCRGTGVAQDATNVLRCVGGRWRVAISKADALRLAAANMQ